MVRGELADSGEPLPRIPPQRVIAGLRYQKNALQFGGSVTAIADQNRVFDNESPTEGATLLKLFGSYSFVAGGATNTITLRLDNATNELYFNRPQLPEGSPPRDGTKLQGGVFGGLLSRGTEVPRSSVPAIVVDVNFRPQMGARCRLSPVQVCRRDRGWDAHHRRQPSQSPALNLRVARALSTPVIDGVLADETWQTRAAPDRRVAVLQAPPRRPRAAAHDRWFAYDEDYLVFRVQVRRPRTRRDQDVDARGATTSGTTTGWRSASMRSVRASSRTTCSSIRAAMQMDALNSAAGNEDCSPDWIVGHRGTADRYRLRRRDARFRFESIRFKGGRDARMGLMFFRRVSRLGVSVSWPALAPGVWVFERHASLMFDRIEPRPGARAVAERDVFRAARRASRRRHGPAADGEREVGFSAQGRPHVDRHARCDGESGLQPGRERCVSSGSESALSDLLSEKRPFFMEGTGIFCAGRRRRRQQPAHGGSHAPHRRSELRRKGDRQRRPRHVRRPLGGGRLGENAIASSTSGARSTASAQATTSARSTPT